MNAKSTPVERLSVIREMNFALNTRGILVIRDIMGEDVELLTNRLPDIIEEFLSYPPHQAELMFKLSSGAPPFYILILLLKFWITNYSNCTFNQVMRKLRRLELLDIAEKLEKKRQTIFESCQESQVDNKVSESSLLAGNEPAQNEFNESNKKNENETNLMSRIGHNLLILILALVVLILSIVIILML